MSSFGVNVLGNSRGVLLRSALLSASLVWSEVLPLSSPKDHRIHYQNGAELLHSLDRAQRLHRNAPAKLHRWHSTEPVPATEGTWTCLKKPGKTGGSETETPAGRKAQIFQKSRAFGDSLKENSIIFVWQRSIRRTFSVSGSPEKKFPEKQENQRTDPGCRGWQSLCRKGLDPTGAPDLWVEPQGDCWALGWELQRQKTKPGENVPGTKLLGNLIPSCLQDSSL